MDSPIIKTDGNTKTTSSFIPKQETPASYRRKASSEGIFFIVAILILIVAISSWGGLMFYEYKLSDDKAEKDTLLVQKGSEVFEIEKDLISDLQKLDTQLTSVGALLLRHTTLTPLFVFLEDNTLTTSVRFSSMSYSLENDGAHINLSGEAKDYSSLAYQEDVFEKNPLVRNWVFGDYNLADNGNVNFSLGLILDPAVISYVNVFNGSENSGI